MSELVLIVDDEEDLLTTLEYNVHREGFATRTAVNGRDALLAVGKSPLPDLILLDVMLPDISGLEVCRILRAQERTRHVPVVMLTACQEEIDRVVGFEVGADDYVTKPFSVRELLLRVRAILRRRNEQHGAVDQMEIGRLRIDSGAHRCWVDDQEVGLTALEFRLLTTLVERRGRVQTRDVLLEDVWGLSGDITTRTVDTHVKRLRHKLGPGGDCIETLRGVGYRFRSELSHALPLRRYGT